MSEREFRDVTDDIDDLLADPALEPALTRRRSELERADRRYAMGLAALRQALDLTQADLAGRLGVSQANVAQVEKRGDMLISTLRSYLEAIGGDVSILVSLPGGEEIEVALQALAPSSPAASLAVDDEPRAGRFTRRRGKVARYCVNKNAAPNGDHEVHNVAVCGHLPKPQNRLDLGEYKTCEAALAKARETYQQVNGCAFCMPDCVTT